MGKSRIYFYYFLAGIVVLPYLFACNFIFPVVDDLSYAAQGSDGLVEHYVQNYQNWCGRYTSNFFILLNGWVSKDLLLYRLYPVFLVIGLLIAINYFLKSIVIIEKPVRFLYSFIILATYLAVLPNSAEGIYWYTGSVTYVFPAIFALLFGRYLLNWNISGRAKGIKVAIASLFIFFIVGFNEALLLLAFVSIMLCLVLLWSKCKVLFWQLLIVFFAVVIGFFLDVFSPGTISRASLFPEGKQLFRSFYMSCLQIVRFTGTWLLHPITILFSLLTLTMISNSMIKLKFHDQLMKMHWTIFPLSYAIIVFCAVFPPYWATGMLGQHRTVNSVFIVFLIMHVFTLFYITGKLKESGWFLYLRRGATLLSILLLWFAAQLFIGNGSQILKDYTMGRLTEYKHRSEERFLLFETSKGASVIVEKFENPPKSIFVTDLTENPDHWINKTYSIYYGLSEVRAE